MTGALDIADKQIRDKISELSQVFEIVGVPDMPKEDKRAFLAHALKDLWMAAKTHPHCFNNDDIDKILGVAGYKKDGACASTDADIISAAFKVVRYVSKTNEHCGKGGTVSKDQEVVMDALQLALDKMSSCVCATVVQDNAARVKPVHATHPKVKGGASRVLGQFFKARPVG